MKTSHALITVISVAALSFDSNAQSQPRRGVSVSTLMQWSNQDEARFDSYVLGVLDSNAGTRVCLPSPKPGKAMRLRDITTLVRAYAFRFPDRRDELAVDLVAAALAERWPCSK